METKVIKGKFAATVEIDIAIPENAPYLLPFEQLQEAFHNRTEQTIKEILEDEFGEIATVKVVKQRAELYYCKELGNNIM